MVILMTMGESLSLAEVKAHLSEIVGRVARQHERVTVTVHGRPSAIPADDEAVRQLSSSDAEIARGEGESEQDLAQAMRLRGRTA